MAFLNDMKKETKVKIKAPKLKEEVLVDKNSTSTAVATGEIESKEQVKIVPILVNLGREDLNALANKINEIISYINQK